MMKNQFNLAIQEAFQRKIMEVLDEFERKEKPDDIGLTDISFNVGSAFASALYEKIRDPEQGLQMTEEQANEFEAYCEQLYEGFVGKVRFLLHSQLVSNETDKSQLQ